MTAFISWYILITLLGWLTFPLAYYLFPALADRGYTLARAFRPVGLGLCVLVIRLAWYRAKRYRRTAAGAGHSGRIKHLGIHKVPLGNPRLVESKIDASSSPRKVSSSPRSCSWHLFDPPTLKFSQPGVRSGWKQRLSQQLCIRQRFHRTIHGFRDMQFPTIILVMS